MVQSQTLARIRRVVGQFLTDTCTIEREALTTGEYGQPTHSWELVASAVPCRLLMIKRDGSGVVTAADQETMQEQYSLIVANTVTLDANYRVTVGGIEYDVVRLETSLTDEAYHKAIVARRR